MNDKERNLQHAMMSFALWGGMLVKVGTCRLTRDGRPAIRPTSYPIRPRNADGFASRTCRSPGPDRGFCNSDLA